MSTIINSQVFVQKVASGRKFRFSEQFVRTGFISFFIFISSFSYGQYWVWGKQGAEINHVGYSNGFGVAVDHSHNAIVTGILYRDILKFGHYLLGTGAYNLYTIKYDSAGNIVWAKQSQGSGATGRISYNSVATDASKNIFVTGTFSDSIVFAPFKLRTNAPNAFLVKYDSNGNVLWAHSPATLSTNSYCYGTSTTTDKAGNVFMTGVFYDSVSFGSYILHTANGFDGSVFTVKYSSAGTVLWAVQSLAGSNGEGDAIATDTYGDTYITGKFIHTLNFGAYHFTSSYYTPFLVKYNSNGILQWAKQGVCPGSADTNRAIGITTDADNNIYITGSFDSTLSFGATLLHSKTSSFFFVKYNDAGNVVWAKQAYPYDHNNWFGYSLSSDKRGDIFLSGGASGSSNFKLLVGSDTIKMNNSTGRASVIVQFDTSGMVLCNTIVNDCSGGTNSLGCQVATSPNGYFVYMAGAIKTTVIFNKDTLGSGGYLPWPFVARLQPCFFERDDDRDSHAEHNPESAGELTAASQLKVYPNPFSNSATISISDSSQTTTGNYLEVDDLSGRKVKYAEFTGQQYQLQAQDLAKGLYFVRVFNGENSVIGTAKIVVQ